MLGADGPEDFWKSTLLHWLKRTSIYQKKFFGPLGLEASISSAVFFGNGKVSGGWNGLSAEILSISGGLWGYFEEISVFVLEGAVVFLLYCVSFEK